MHHTGLDDIRPFNFKQGEIPIYAHDRVITKERFDYILQQKIDIRCTFSENHYRC
jgi:phosphoribosyl 1,2-cyclic phosphate phosphodiesterase